VVSFDFIQNRIEWLFQNSKTKIRTKEKGKQKEKNKRKKPGAHLGRAREASRPSSPEPA
jgi:hypothetical protein